MSSSGERQIGVIPSLMDVLSEATQKAKVDHVDLRPGTRGMGQRGGPLSEKQLQRYLAGDPPPGQKIDDWVRVVAKTVGQPEPYAYWAEALKRAKSADSGEPGGEKPQPHR